ncbi:hypothetical protein MIMGU_mgv1a025874mg, partial [Erythranthe guttata]
MAAEAVLGAAVKVLLQNLISVSGEQISLVRYFKKDLKKLRDSVSTIQSFLNDADKKQVNDEAVKQWLKKLESVAYDADNVLDELHYQHKKIRAQRKMKKKVRDFFPYPIRHPEIARKIKKINKYLKEINDEANNYGLQKAVVGAYAPVDGPLGPSAGVETNSFGNDSIFLGRENDVSEIVKKVTTIPNDQVFSILPIVGMCGVGKSTVAREVFDHETIKSYFTKRFWVNVSENFDDVILLNKILTSLKGKHVELGNKEALLEKLQKYLKTKRFLLVLDDVRNGSQEKWDDFINSLRIISYGTGNGIIVTTRLENVASLVKTLPIHRLNNLSDDECWSIIKAKAVGQGNIPSECKHVGLSIAKRCQGLPLVAKMVGGLLHDKSVDEWQSIGKDWLSELGDENSISKILKLSFDHLSSPSLKSCFAYCSIYPKGFHLNRERLVEMWMAEGFLGGNDDMEILGNKFFNQLLENSLLLQVMRKNDYYYMHDLVHDLASSILNSSDQVRYIGFQSINGDSRDILKENASYLRSLLLNDKMCALMFSEFKSLHVLILIHNFREELPSSIGELIHLRCLDISGTVIKCLPNSIGELYHLQTLRAPKVLKKLPDVVKHLISLRHLHIPQIELPPEMGRLTSLRTLPYFGVSNEKGYGIGELGSLSLQGQLKIYNLEKVHDKDVAKSADLLRKPNILKLTLEWSSVVTLEWSPGNRDNEGVLEGLEPHPNLRSLYVCGFRGRFLPSWCSMLNNLTEIGLEDCKDCEQVPTLGHLPHLKNLYLINLRKVKSIGSSFYGIENCSTSGNTITVFPALERLELVEMWRLTEWLEAELMPNPTENRRQSDQVVLVVFPCLEHLMVKDCGQLKSAPSHFPCLKELVIYKMHRGLPLWNICGIKLFSLTILRIDLINGLVCLPGWLFRNNKNLSELWVSCCPKLRELPGDLHNLTALEILSIDDCPNLKTIAYRHESDNEKLLGLSCLRQLSITNCGGLTHLASEMIESCAPSIEKVELRYLSNLRVHMGMLIGSLQKMSRLSVLTICGVKMISADVTVNVTAKYLRILQLEGVGHSGELPDQIQHLTAVSSLYLSYFGEMEELPEWIGNNNNLSSSLRILSLCHCNKLRRLPSKEAMLRLTKLTKLCISRCPMQITANPASCLDNYSHPPQL